MKMMTITLLLCLHLGASAQPTAKDFSRMQWLLGTWQREQTKPGRTAHERWEKISDKEWKGYGVTLQGTDTAFVEKLSLVVKDDKIYYVADVPENQAPVYFTITSITATGFVCENPKHDFPKKISYQLNGDKLLAEISGGEQSMQFHFRRK